MRRISKRKFDGLLSWASPVETGSCSHRRRGVVRATADRLGGPGTGDLPIVRITHLVRKSISVIAKSSDSTRRRRCDMATSRPF
jgi:hypothetical protein